MNDDNNNNNIGNHYLYINDIDEYVSIIKIQESIISEIESFLKLDLDSFKNFLKLYEYNLSDILKTLKTHMLDLNLDLDLDDTSQLLKILSEQINFNKYKYKLLKPVYKLKKIDKQKKNR